MEHSVHTLRSSVWIMELLLRKGFWAVDFAFLFVAAYLCARTVNAFLGAKLTPAPDVSAPLGLTIRPGQSKTSLSPEAVAKLTGLELPKAPDTTGGQAAADAPEILDYDLQEPVKTGLRVRLLGTILANRSEWSLASVEDVIHHAITVCMVGDRIQSAEVTHIERLRVIIKNNGRKEYIDVEPGTGEVAASVAPGAALPSPRALGAGIRALSEETYEVPRDELNRALGSMNHLTLQARIAPAFKDGVAIGFKLFSIRRDSFYSKIGIQNGDIIRRINGYDINSPDKALEVYAKLKESNRIEIEIERKGSSVRRTYLVR
jgi:general secretion pathway protein C